MSAWCYHYIVSCNLHFLSNYGCYYYYYYFYYPSQYLLQFNIFLTVHHSIDFSQVTNLMHTSFIL